MHYSLSYEIFFYMFSNALTDNNYHVKIDINNYSYMQVISVNYVQENICIMSGSIMPLSTALYETRNKYIHTCTMFFFIVLNYIIFVFLIILFL